MLQQFQLDKNDQAFQKQLEEHLKELKHLENTDILTQLAKEGYTSIPGIENSKNNTFLSLALTVEEVAKCYPMVANTLVEMIFAQVVAKNQAKCGCEAAIASLERKSRVLYAEPRSTSFADMATKVEKVDGGYNVTGTKLYTPESADADVLILAANLIDGDKRKPVLAVVNKEDSKEVTKEVAYGVDTISTTVIDINTKIDEDKVINITDEMATELAIWRTMIASSAIGLAHRNLVSAVNFSKGLKNEEKQPLSAEQAYNFKMTDTYAEIEAARLVTYYAVSLIDAGTPSTKFSCIAKAQACEAAITSNSSASSVLGNLGNFYNEVYLQGLQLAYNRETKDGTTINAYETIYKEALAKR